MGGMTAEQIMKIKEEGDSTALQDVFHDCTYK